MKRCSFIKNQDKNNAGKSKLHLLCLTNGFLSHKDPCGLWLRFKALLDVPTLITRHIRYSCKSLQYCIAMWLPATTL